MKLEVFPYRFRNKANAAVLHRRGFTVLERYGAKALYSLYTAGASFRLAPDSPVDAVVFDLDDLDSVTADRLDHIHIDNSYIVKSPSAVLRIPGKENRRKVFYGLDREYPYEDYGEAYRQAFMRFAAMAGLAAMDYDHCMDSPKQLTFGMPYPALRMAVEGVALEGTAMPVPPMPLSRWDAKEMFGINGKVLLPTAEYFRKYIPKGGERYYYVWEKIVPAAFAWYHFFSTTTETRWGLSATGYTFKDCVKAVEREVLRIGVKEEELYDVIRGSLEDAYRKFRPNKLRPYSPRTADYMERMQDKRARRALWKRKTKEEKHKVYVKQWEWQKRRKEMILELEGKSTKDIIRKKAGRKPTMDLGTIEALEEALKAGKITRPYYYKRRKILLSSASENGGMDDAK